MLLAAEHSPASEAQETLNEMLVSLDLSPSNDPSEELAKQLFESEEMRQHLENLLMQDIEFPRPNRFSDLSELRGALLL